MSLARYEQQFANLNINRSHDRISPHKMCMMLAVIELIDDGQIQNNRIYFNNTLKAMFTKHFNKYRHEGDRDNPHLPFFHLKTEPFWHHRVRAGRTASYKVLTTASGPGVIQNNIAYAYLDETLFELLKNQFARDYLKSAVESTLDTHNLRAILEQPTGWDWLECELTIQSYFSMLEKELRGERYNKAEYRRALAPKLNDRTESSIEFKHQNISAILVELGFPYIAGYRPAFNYQHQLKEAVKVQLVEKYKELVAESEIFMDSRVDELPDIDWEVVMESAPEPTLPSAKTGVRDFNPRKYNYAERESNNRRLGESGELFVMDYERHRLSKAGRSDLVNEIEWTSKEKGDGAGYDIRSFIPERDEELFIEVKTTNSGKYQPFLISENEVAFANQYSDQYALYRVFQFTASPKFFSLYGNLAEHVHLNPQVYRATY